MKINTSELIRPALDWAAARALGYAPKAFTERDCGQGAIRPLSKWCGIDVTPSGHTIWSPSTNWAQGGPIIEREKFDVVYQAGGRGDEWTAFANDTDEGGNSIECGGPTPLIAAMRCFVASKLGDEVDVPQELLA